MKYRIKEYTNHKGVTKFYPERRFSVLSGWESMKDNFGTVAVVFDTLQEARDYIAAAIKNDEEQYNAWRDGLANQKTVYHDIE